MRFFGATSACTWVMGLLGLMSVSTWAQKIYYPKNQEFGAPLTEEDWKALRQNPKVSKSPQRKPASVESVPMLREITIPPRSHPSKPMIQEELRKNVRVPAGVIDTGEGIRTVNRYSAIKLAPLAFYSTLDASNIGGGGSTAGVSNFNYGLETEWRHQFGNGLSSQLGLRAHRLSLRTSTNIQDKALPQTIVGVNAGVGYAFASWGAFDLQGMLSEELFLRVTTSNFLTIDKVFIPQVRGTLHLDLFTLYPFEIGLSSTGIVLLPKKTTTQKVELGKGYRVALIVEQGSVVEGLRWLGSLYMEEKRQNTNLLRQIRRDFGLEIGFSWGDIP